MAQLLCEKSEDRRLFERFLWPDDYGWRVLMMDRVREMLRLETNAGMSQMISGVKWHARLRRPHLHRPATLRFDEASSHLHPFRVAKHIVMIITVQLRLQLLDPLA